jgi:hypothetical protein
LSGNDSAASALAESRFGCAVAAHGLEPELWETLREAASRGQPLLIGPRLPTSTPSGLGALPAPLTTATDGLLVTSEAELPHRLSELARSHEAFQLDPGEALRASLFRDRAGIARVLFVTNTSQVPRLAKLDAAYLQSAADALDGDVFRARFGALEIPLSPHSVRMLELK